MRCVSAPSLTLAVLQQSDPRLYGHVRAGLKPRQLYPWEGEEEAAETVVVHRTLLMLPHTSQRVEEMIFLTLEIAESKSRKGNGGTELYAWPQRRME